jgi:hypothetical protein
LLLLCRCKDEVNPPKKGYKFTNQPLKDLGIKFTPLREYLYEAVKSLQEKGFIQKTTDTKVQMLTILYEYGYQTTLHFIVSIKDVQISTDKFSSS